MSKRKHDPNKKSKKRNNILNSYAKYSNLAIQVVIILLAAIFGGHALDIYLEFDFPAFTLGFSFVAIIAVLYIFIRGVTK